MKIIKEKAVCFTGHRILEEDFSELGLKETIFHFLETGYKYFLVGMALGFDTKCFLILREFKKIYNDIKIIACIPCENQAERFSEKDKDLYYEMIDSADEKVVLSKSYYNGCMHKRNQFMVDNSSVVIAYLNKNSGGTYSTVKYAQKCQKEIYYI